MKFYELLKLINLKQIIDIVDLNNEIISTNTSRWFWSTQTYADYLIDDIECKNNKLSIKLKRFY